MKKHKSIFYTLRKRPDGRDIKHTKRYFDYEDEYLDEDYSDEVYSDEEYFDEDYEDEYYDDNEYDDGYVASDEYEDEQYAADDSDEDYQEDYMAEEYSDEDYAAEEYLADEYVDDEYLEEEYADEEYDESEYSDEMYSEEYGEYDDEDEYYTDEDEYYDEYVDRKTAKRVLKPKKADWTKNIKWWCIERFHNMDFMDWILVFTTIFVLFFAGLTFSAVSTNNAVEEEVEALEPLGEALASLGIVGESGLQQMMDAGASGMLVGIEADASAELADANTESESQEANYEENSEASRTRISVIFESVEKDLKVRFKNASTGSLITGTAFQVEIRNQATGNKLVLVDDDKDGVIYKKGIRAGKFDAIIASIDKYRFPEEAQTIVIKDKVDYVVINVEDEVKQEAEIEVAKEDTEIKVAEQEATTAPATTPATLSNTVEYVVSSKIANAATYTKIDKSKIADPGATASIRALNLKFDDFSFSLNETSKSLVVGESTTLSTGLSDSESDGTKITYSTSWKSSDDSVATVDNGSVKGIKAGSAVITCTVEKTTEISGKKTETETVLDIENAISEEEYEKLSDEDKEKYTKKSTEDITGKLPSIFDGLGSVTIYIPSKEVSVEVPVNEKKTEKATKTCDITVKDVAIKSAVFELTNSGYSVNVGSTVTIAPSKIVYTMNDGSTKTITSDFPTIVWTPSDISIATVSNTGVVTGVKTGATSIKATIYDVKTEAGDAITTSASVTVNEVKALTLSLDKTSEQTIKVGNNLTITPTVANYVSDKGVTWSSSDTSVATVSSAGVVTGVKVGSATITCTTNEKNAATGKNITATCPIKVVNNASTDTSSKLKDTSGKQVYVKNSSGNYVEAVYADYYTASEFYLQNETTYTYYGWQTIGNKTYYYDKNGKVVTGSQVIQGVSYKFNSDGSLVTSGDGGTRGIDVSKWNGNIDWASVKASGIDYVIIRCGYRGSSTGALIEDANFKKNIQGATAAGLKVGVYIFSQAVDEVEAVKEASFAISLVQGYKLTYPIFIDTEKSGGRGDNIGNATRTSILNAFCQTIESAGYKAGIYASKTWYESKMDINSLTKYKIWVARYSATNDYTASKYDMWQYTASGSVSGISGKVDMNYSYLGY